MRLAIERVRELLAVDGTRRMYGGVLMDAALVRDLAADLLDDRASLAAERARREAAEAECARLRVDLEATERARQAAEEERDTALELVAPDAMEVARQRDARDAERLHSLAVARVALEDTRGLVDYWRKQATGMAPSVDGMRALCTMLFPGGTGCVVDPERVVEEVERLRERVADAEAEASRWGDAVVAIGDAIGMQGRSSAEIVEGVRGLRPSIVVLCRSIAAAYDALDDGNAARATYRAEGARRCADEIEKP